jgi:hypothetical protein
MRGFLIGAAGRPAMPLRQECATMRSRSHGLTILAAFRKVTSPVHGSWGFFILGSSCVRQLNHSDC